jgi:hypothetical protein
MTRVAHAIVAVTTGAPRRIGTWSARSPHLLAQARATSLGYGEQEVRKTDGGAHEVMVIGTVIVGTVCACYLLRGGHKVILTDRHCLRMEVMDLEVGPAWLRRILIANGTRDATWLVIAAGICPPDLHGDLVIAFRRRAIAAPITSMELGLRIGGCLRQPWRDFRRTQAPRVVGRCVRTSGPE